MNRVDVTLKDSTMLNFKSDAVDFSRGMITFYKNRSIKFQGLVSELNSMSISEINLSANPFLTDKALEEKPIHWSKRPENKAKVRSWKKNIKKANKHDMETNVRKGKK